jgi:hypothetical protein
MQMDEGLDTGDMLLKTEVLITSDDTGDSLHDKLAAAGAALCVETLRRLEDGSILPEKTGGRVRLPMRGCWIRRWGTLTGQKAPGRSDGLCAA